MRMLTTKAKGWAVLFGLSLVVGLIGPFGTFDYMSVLPRLAYWTAVVLATALAGTFVATLVEAVLKPRLPLWLAAAIGGAAAGPVVAFMVALINFGTFGFDVAPIDLASLVVYCTLISIAVTVMGASLSPQQKPAADGAASQGVAERMPALLERLPRPQRGRLLHIAVSDHYVDVTTDRGTAMVLMRLSDAIRETEPVAGMQVHRSHWVALDAVQRGTRQGGKPVLELINGTTVPVSRTFLPAVRQAGLLS